MHRDHHTLVAELLPAPMFDDPTLGHPYHQYDPLTGVTTRHSVILADRQPAGIPLTWNHDQADADPAGTERVGTLRYLERDGWGAIWGLFTVPPDLADFGLADGRHVSIGFTGKPLHYRQKRAPTADPTMTPATAAYLRDGQAAEAIMDHVALTPTPATGSYKQVAIVPVDITVGAGQLGYPHGHDEHRSMIERAARHLEAQTCLRRCGAPATSDSVELIDSPYYVDPQRRALLEDDDDVVDPVPAASRARTRNGMPVIRRFIPDAHLTLR